MRLQMGDVLSDEISEWRVIGRPLRWSRRDRRNLMPVKRRSDCWLIAETISPESGLM
jgi:hypothetical protein